MLIPLMLSLVAVAPGWATPAFNKPNDPGAPVKAWLSGSGKYAFGDRAKVYAQTAQDGYLVVLRADALGRVRVLFPVDPADDQFVRGGRKYELKGRGGREAFVADDTTGEGVIVTAYSKAPFRFEKFVRNGRWNYRALASDSVMVDPEAALLDIVGAMQPDDRFSYDLATYVVAGPRYARGGYGSPYSYNPYAYSPYRYGRLYGYSPYWYGPGVGITLGFGTRFRGGGHGFYRGGRGH